MRRVLIGLGLIGFNFWSPAAPAQPAGSSPEFQVNTYTTSRQRSPAIAGDPSGDFVIVWHSPLPSAPYLSIFGRRYDSMGAPSGGEFQVNTYTTYHKISPAVAMDPSGAFVVVWTSYNQDGWGTGVFGQRFDSSGAPAAGEFQVNTYTPGSQEKPAVAMNGTGGFVIVWSGDGPDDDFSGVFGRRYDGAGFPLGAEFHVNTYTTNFQNDPAVAVDPSGRFVVVWTSSYQDGSFAGVFGQRYDSVGMPLGGEFQVNTYTTGRQSDASVAMDSSGGFVVVWTSNEQDGFGDGVFGQRYDSMGGPMGGEFQVNSYTFNSQYTPKVAMDSSGSFVVVWTSDWFQDGSFAGVFSQRYDSAGAPMGGEFQVNTFTTGDQAFPAVAIDSSGAFAVAWQSYEQDGSYEGIFARTFPCSDTDADGLCDFQDVLLVSPVNGAELDCSNPRVVRPAIAWDPGNYEKFRVLIGTDPNFATGTMITSGDTLLTSNVWTPSGKKWRSACKRALAADPNRPILFVKVFGVDVDVSKRDLYRKTFSQVVQVSVQ